MPPGVEEFLAGLKADQGLSTNTLLAYRADLRQFGRVIGQSQVTWTGSGLSAEAVGAYVRWLLAQSYKASTIARKMAAVRTYLRSSEDGSRPELLAPLKPPPAGHSASRVLSREEVERLLSGPVVRGRARDLRDAAILAVLYYTGLRATEAVGLTMDRVDLNVGYLHFPGEFEGRALGDALAPMKAYLEQGRAPLGAGMAERAVFLNQRGGSLSRQGMWLVVKRWAGVAGLGPQISPHTLRLSRAAHLLEQGIPKREIQRFLRLSSAHGLRLPRPGQSTHGGSFE